MKYYYYLKDDEVIQEGDEFCSIYDLNDNLGWWACQSSVGCTVKNSIKRYFSNNAQVRREIKATKLGNYI